MFLLDGREGQFLWCIKMEIETPQSDWRKKADILSFKQRIWKENWRHRKPCREWKEKKDCKHFVVARYRHFKKDVDELF